MNRNLNEKTIDSRGLPASTYDWDTTTVSTEMGTGACIVGKTVQGRVIWDGYMVRMVYEGLSKSADTKSQEG